MSKKEGVAFFGPWIGEFGWELMTWQAWCRQEAKKYEKVYCCSFPDMEPLYRDFSEFIPHSHQGRALDWQKKENMDKAVYEIPEDVTKQILPFKRYKPEGDFISFGADSKRHGYSNLIHARGIGRGGKDYPLDMWEKLIDELPGTIACIGSEKDHLIGDVADMRGMPLDALADLIANSGVVIGQSSGVMHLATLCRTPIVVWGDNRTYFNESLHKRYRETWNPFNSQVWYLADDEWKPDPDKITYLLKGVRRMAEEHPKEKGNGKDTVPLMDVPIGKEVRDKLGKATQSGRYFITISCLAPDDKLYHYWKTQDFPNSDVFKTMEHLEGELKKKFMQSKNAKGRPEVFEWA